MRRIAMALLLTGCTGTAASISPGVDGDAGVADAGRRDLGAVDSGTPGDAGPEDAGMPDLGPADLGPPDTGPVDMGPPDLGPTPGMPPDLEVTGIAVFQSVKVSVVEDGATVVDRNAPVIAGREALVRVYVAPGEDYVERELRGRLDVLEDGEVVVSREALRTITRESRDENADTLYSFVIEAEHVTETAELRVVLIDDLEGTPESDPEPNDARFPRSGGSLALGAVGNGGLELVVVPVRYEADGSDREPTLGMAELEAIEDHFLAMFPLAPGQLRLSVREVYATDTEVRRDGTGFGTLLDEVRRLRTDDSVPPETYYYGAIAPADSFGAFCQRACVTGLGFVSAVRSQSTRVSVGIWYPGEGSQLTLLHEVGHTLGRPHAPCGGASGADSEPYPHDGGTIGVFAIDERSATLLPPTSTDFMAYCDDQWISDYNYERIHERLVDVSGPTPLSWGLPATHHVFRDDMDGRHYGGTVEERPVGASSPNRRLVEVLDGLGRSLGFVAAHDMELSDEASHVYFVPDVPGAASYRIGETRFAVPGAR
ncbi:MAG: hypothetical protein AAF447_01620 [Myxococcota bacterium]